MIKDVELARVIYTERLVNLCRRRIALAKLSMKVKKSLRRYYLKVVN